MNLKISQKIIKKITEKHKVHPSEIEECFWNKTKISLIDKREKNKTNPPTFWFIAKTDSERLLKIVFIDLLDGTFEIKSAFEPNEEEIRIYEKYA